MSREILEPIFDAVSSAMEKASKECSVAIAEVEAERLGFVQLGDGKPSQRYDWERREGLWRINLIWRWYDPSKAFSIQPDMIIMALDLFEGEQLIRSAQERYED